MKRKWSEYVTQNSYPELGRLPILDVCPHCSLAQPPLETPQQQKVECDAVEGRWRSLLQKVVEEKLLVVCALVM